MALISITVVPLGTETTSLSEYVARVVEVLKDEENIKYETTSMGTTIEGDLERLLSLVPKMHKAAFDAGSKRVLTTIGIDDRQDKPTTMSGKMESLKRKLRH